MHRRFSKSRYRPISIAVIVLCVFISGQSQTRIVAVQGKLFYNNTGTFSDDLFSKTIDLWNVRFDYVSSAFVTIELAGGNENSRRIDKLEFNASYLSYNAPVRKIVVHKIVSLEFDEKGHILAGFWLDELGCDPVTISTNIRGQRTVMRKKIALACGE